MARKHKTETIEVNPLRANRLIQEADRKKQEAEQHRQDLLPWNVVDNKDKLVSPKTLSKLFSSQEKKKGRIFLD